MKAFVQSRIHPDAAAALLMAGIIREDGATVSLDARRVVPSHGYVVGGYRHHTLTIQRDQFRTGHLDYWLSQVMADDSVEFVGSWFDRQHDVIAFDAVSIHPSLRESVDVALMRGEQCVFDLAEKQSVWAYGTMQPN